MLVLQVQFHSAWKPQTVNTGSLSSAHYPPSKPPLLISQVSHAIDNQWTSTALLFCIFFPFAGDAMYFIILPTLIFNQAKDLIGVLILNQVLHGAAKGTW